MKEREIISWRLSNSWDYYFLMDSSV
jgi:hypothetical protein